jgi:hypothetical protein
MDSGLRRNDTEFLENAVTLYTIIDPKPGQPDLPLVLADSFSWTAAILSPFYFVAHGLWLELIAWGLALIALVLLARVIGTEAAAYLYLLGAIWIGFAASSLRQGALLRGGWRRRGDVFAADRDMAQLEALR